MSEKHDKPEKTAGTKKTVMARKTTRKVQVISNTADARQDKATDCIANL